MVRQRCNKYEIWEETFVELEGVRVVGRVYQYIEFVIIKEIKSAHNMRDRCCFLSQVLSFNGK